MKSKKSVLVVGAGISGLTTAICLREHGFNVVIVAEKFALELVSNVAGALWEWPPAACGKHKNPRSLSRAKVWCMTSYRKFKALQAEYGSTATGIYLRKVNFYFRETIENLPTDYQKMNELKDRVDDFRRGLTIASHGTDIICQKEIKDAYQHMAPTVDTDIYMNWLLRQARVLDCEIKKERIVGNLVEQEFALRDRFHCDAIVNCAGIGSIETANDPDMFPLRGALVRVKDKQGLINEVHCIVHEETSSNERSIIFIVPRGKNNAVILGGIAQPHQWGTSLNLDDPIVWQMYARCLQFLPELKALPLDDEEPVRTGLRPFTKTNVCVESVPGTRLFYNYGHGGAGVTLSWGCAQEITERIQTMFQLENTQTLSPDNFVDNKKQTIFLLQDLLQISSDLSVAHNRNCNLIMLCSRRGLSKINPAQYEHLDQVQVLDCYDLPHLLAAFNQAKKYFNLTFQDCRVITNDEFSVQYAADMRKELSLYGDKPQQILPFINKPALKQALKDTNIRTLNKVFSPKQYQKFALSELLQGASYNVSAIIISSKISYFAPCKHFRPNDEFLNGKPIGNFIVREQDPVYSILLAFLTNVLSQLPFGYPANGVINLDLFIDDNTNQPVLLEISARAPGGLVSQMFEAYQGVALSKWHLYLQMGFSGKPIHSAKKHQTYSAYCIHPRQAGTITTIVKPIFRSQVELFWQICPGQTTSKAESVRDVALAIFLSNDNWEELKQDYELAHSQQYFQVKTTSKLLQSQPPPRIL